MAQTQEPYGAGPPARGRRILIVDDNRDAASSLAMLLELSGYTVATAHDGAAAMETAATFRPEVVLLDIGLPTMNGYEVARRMRKEAWGERIGLIAVTGRSESEDRQRSSEAGFDAHVVKPIEHASLMQLLADKLGGFR